MTVHKALGASWQASAARPLPTPSSVVALLQQSEQHGTSITEVLDSVSMARVANSVRESSFSTYMSRKFYSDYILIMSCQAIALGGHYARGCACGPLQLGVARRLRR